MILQSRRSFFSGLIAAPFVISSASLMPLRGVKYDPIVRVQSYPFIRDDGENGIRIGYCSDGVTGPHGEYRTYQGPMSKALEVEKEMQSKYGRTHWKTVNCGKSEFDTIGIRGAFAPNTSLRADVVDKWENITPNTGMRMLGKSFRIKYPLGRIDTEKLIEVAEQTIRWGS